MNRPLLWLSLGLVMGVVWASEWRVHYGFYMGLCVFFCVLGAWYFHRYQKALYVILFCVGLSSGLFRFSLADFSNQSVLASFLSVPLSITGEVDSLPQIDGDRVAFDFLVRHMKGSHREMDIPNEKVRISVRLSSRDEVIKARNMRRFDTLVMRVRLNEVPQLRNPGSFDYRSFLYRQGIRVLGFVDGLVDVYSTQRGWHPYIWIDELRRLISSQIEQIYPADYSGIVRGMLLGERDQVDSKIIEEYSMLGIIHLLSISGLHVGVFVASLYFFLMLLGFTRERAGWIIFMILPVYAILTGAGAPVIRSCIMAMLALVAMMLRQFKDTLSFLLFALIVQLLWDPYLLWGAGFQLSYLITAALIVGVPPLVDKIPTPWKGLNQAVSVTMVAQVASFPIMAIFFHSVSYLSWFVNLIVVPLFSVFVIPLALIAVLISVFSVPLGEFAAFLSTLFLDMIQVVVNFFLQFSWITSSVVSPSWMWIICYGLISMYLWVACIGGFFYTRTNQIVACILFFLSLVYVHQSHLWWRDETRVSFLDVGQGDCAVLETRGGKVVLIDGGGTPQFPRPKWQQRRRSYDVGKQIVVPYLKYRGIQAIDYVVLTHGDADHIGGVQAVAEKFPIRRVIRNSHLPHSKLEKRLMDTLKERGSRVYVPPMGLNWELEPGVRWQFLHPDPQNLLGDDQKTNDDSIVCLLSIYGKKVLMTGDIGSDAEREIISRWKLDPIDVLKVAHHGSKYSTDDVWLRAIRPKEAVISVGANNCYGHPTEDVLNRLKLENISTFRTDQRGAIIYHFYPHAVKRESMLNP